MTNTTRKINESTIEFSKVIPQEIVPEKMEKVEYDFNFLVNQKKVLENALRNVIARHVREVEEGEANLAEVTNLLEECARLGIDGVRPETEGV